MNLLDIEHKYKTECRRMGAELKDIDVYKLHVKDEKMKDFMTCLIWFVNGLLFSGLILLEVAL